jgi:hypothetical protein
MKKGRIHSHYSQYCLVISSRMPVSENSLDIPTSCLFAWIGKNVLPIAESIVVTENLPKYLVVYSEVLLQSIKAWRAYWKAKHPQISNAYVSFLTFFTVIPGSYQAGIFRVSWFLKIIFKNKNSWFLHRATPLGLLFWECPSPRVLPDTKQGVCHTVALPFTF